MPCVCCATTAIARPMLASSAAVRGNWNERATLRPLEGESNRQSVGAAPLQVVELGQRRHAAAECRVRRRRP